MLRNYAQAEFKSILTVSDRILTLPPPYIPELKTSLQYLLQTRNALTALDSRIPGLIEQEIEEVEEADHYTHFLHTKDLLNHQLHCITAKKPSKIDSRSFSVLVIILEKPRKLPILVNSRTHVYRSL